MIAAVLIVVAAAAVIVVTRSHGTAGEAGGSASPSRSRATPSGSATPGAPSGLTSTLSGFTVVLTWVAAPAGETIVDYAISRSGTSLATVPGTATTYRDGSAEPSQSYVYEVAAVGPRDAVSPTAVLRVTVPRPPLAVARLEGNYNVIPKLVSKYGFQSYRSADSYGFHFTPKCSTGPCRVTLLIQGGTTLKVPMTRVGARYSGSATGDLNIRCGSSSERTTVTVQLRMTRAADVNGSWEVTKFTGTMTQETPSQFGCVSSQAVESLVGFD